MERYIDADLLYRETEKKIKANNEYRMAVVDGEFLDLINDAPTEDVVPRSEVEEIFEEIRKRAYSERGFFVVNSDIDDFIAELKNKYTEEKK